MAVNGQDIGLLFGVLGGGSVDGESGALIKKQLENIVKGLNSKANTNARRITLTLDRNNTAIALKKSLETVVNTVNGQNKFKVKVSKIDASSAIDQFKNELNAMLRTLKVDTGFSVTMGPNGATSAVKEIAGEAKSAILPLNEVEAKLKEIAVTNQSISTNYKGLTNTLSGQASSGSTVAQMELTRLKDLYIQLGNLTNNLAANKKNATQEEIDAIYRIQAAIQDLITANQRRIQAERDAHAAANAASAERERALQREAEANANTKAMYKDAVALQKRMSSALTNFSKASNTDWYKSIEAGKAEIDAMLGGVTALDRTRLNNLIDSFNQAEGHIRASNMAAKSLGDTIVANAKKFASWFGTSRIIMMIFHGLKNMLKTVKEIDTAMTELRKVTNETDVAYDKFLKNSVTRAKQLGSTVADVVRASADFARIGHGVDDASTLADAAIVYKNVGDGIENIDQASSSIISTMQAFGVEANNVMLIVDKFNSVGNRFAISSGGIGEALLNSAASLQAAGNTLDESIALITAANEIIQNPEKVGTAMKTMSMYMRAAKTEAEEAGISTEGMANSVSELRGQILALTGNKVDIMIDDSTFKSTVDILSELASVWGTLKDTQRANITELIGGGVRNANVISALMNNFSKVEEIIEVSSESAGSALKENEKVLESIEGKISKFKATTEELSLNLFNSDVIKGVIDFGTGLMTALSALAEIDILLPSIIASLVVYKSFQLAKEAAAIAAQSEAAVSSIAARMVVEKQTTDALTASYLTLNAAQQASVRDKITLAMTTGALSEETGKAILANLGLATSTIGVKTATDSLNVSFKSLLLSNPLGWVLLAISLIPTVISLIGRFTKSAAELREEYNETASELKDLNSELETTNDRISELVDKANSGAITFVEQEELDRLYETNEQLERSIRLKNEAAEIDAQQANDALVGEFNNERFDSKEDQYILSDAEAYKDQNSYIIDAYNELLAGGQSAKWSALSPEDQAKAAEIIDTYNKMLADASEATSKNTDLSYEDYIQQLIDRYNQLKGLGVENLSDGQLQQYNEVRAELVSIGSQLQSDFIDQYIGDGEQVDFWNSLADAIDACINPAEHYAKELENLPEATKSVLEDEGSSGSLTADRINELAVGCQELSDWMTKTGTSAEELAAYYNDIATEGNNATETTSSLGNALAKNKTDVEQLDAVLAKMSANDFSTLTEEDFTLLLELMPELRAEFLAYQEALKAGAKPQEAQADLMDKIRKAGRSLKASKVADIMNDVVDAVDAFGGDSFQAQNAMAQLAMYCPNLVGQLYNVETGLYMIGNSAAAAKAALLSMGDIELTMSLEESVSAIGDIKSQITNVKDTISKVGADSMQGQQLGDHLDYLNSKLSEAKEIQNTYEQIENLQTALKITSKGGGGGGGKSETPADKIKDSFDALSSSIEICIQKEEEYFENGKKNLDSEVMREALMQQVAYYQQIQREAATALEAVKEYYRGQGMSEGAIEQQSQVQDLTNDYLDATKNVRDAVDRMTSAIIDAFGEAIDSMQSVYDTLHKAADEYASSGYIAVDTLQEIISHGVEYLALLKDENGQLSINEESIQNIIAARTEQMAVETALAYVEALHAANTAGNVTELNRLLYATQEVTGAQWDLVYATLALEGFDEEQNRAALHVVDSLRAMSEHAQRSIFETAESATDALKETREELEKMQSGVNDILEYTMDMIEHEIEQQIEAIEEQKEAFAEYIEMQKEALDNAKDEADYGEKKADILKQLAALQSNIDSLSLVGTREAEAEKAALLEEQAELQKELADLQGDYAVEAQKEALDKMQKAYEEEKDGEIKDAEASISSQQKLYDMAIDRIENHWNDLYNNLLDWNHEYGSALTEEIDSAWDSACEAADRYGSYLEAIKELQDDINDIDEEISNSSGGSGGKNNNYDFGEKPQYDHSTSDEANINVIVKRMKTNSNNWATASSDGQKRLAAQNEQYAETLRTVYGVNAIRGDDGVWYIDHIGGEQLYKKYGVYHTGGIVGGGDVKSNEQFALLKKKEWVLNENMVDNLTRQMSLMSRLGDFAGKLFNTSGLSIGNKIADMFASNSQRLLSATNARPIEISIGDTYISGMPDETVKQHQAISKKLMDDLARQLGARW